MKWLLVGLGNPTDEYEGSRHNVGADTLGALEKKLPAQAKVAKLNVYMNNSGGPMRKRVPSKKAAERLLVVHDDLDLPLGTLRLSFGSGSGGHRGVESVIKALGTKDFARLRIGISPATPSGKVKKPDSAKIVDFVLGQFRPPEREKLKKVRSQALKGIELLVEEGLERAMTEVNAR